MNQKAPRNEREAHAALETTPPPKPSPRPPSPQFSPHGAFLAGLLVASMLTSIAALGALILHFFSP